MTNQGCIENLTRYLFSSNPNIALVPDALAHAITIVKRMDWLESRLLKASESGEDATMKALEYLVTGEEF